MYLSGAMTVDFFFPCMLIYSLFISTIPSWASGLMSISWMQLQNSDNIVKNLL